jgi:hypothetical protein
MHTNMIPERSIHVTAITVLVTLLVSCASHGAWSRSDRGAWTALDEVIGNNKTNYYVEHWGEPVSRYNINVSDDNGNLTPDGEELLWLWKPDGTGLSEKQGEGWELFLSFNEKGQFSRWRIGSYRTTLTVPEVIAATRKFEYRFGAELLNHLGLLKEQHEIAPTRFEYPSANLATRELDALKEEYGMGEGWRGWTINRMQEVVKFIAETTFRADNAARNLHGRLATDEEVLAWLDEETKGTNSSRQHQRAAHSSPNSIVPGQRHIGLLGGGFLGPYTPNAYGPGMNADATGRPFIWRPDFGGPALGPITPNAYGPGIGMDATGRPVLPACPPGWAGSC